MSFIKKPRDLRDAFVGERIYSVRDGTHLIMPGKLHKPMGAVVAREVYVRGFANVHVIGLVRVVQDGGFVIAEENAQVDARSGQTEARGSVVEASGNAAIVAREVSVIHVYGDNVTVHAYDDSIVIVRPNIRACVKLFDRAQMVRISAKGLRKRPQPIRLLRAA